MILFVELNFSISVAFGVGTSLTQKNWLFKTRYNSALGVLGGLCVSESTV